MNNVHYKDVTTARGLVYHYHYAPARERQVTLLFVHGFPSTSRDWRHQVIYFQAQGYGVVVPDLLGYGGTDKPTDPELYIESLMTQDLVDILDAVGVDKAIAIGHDW